MVNTIKMMTNSEEHAPVGVVLFDVNVE